MYTTLVYRIGSTRFSVSAHEGFFSVGVTDRVTGERATYLIDGYDTLRWFMGGVLDREPYMRLEV